MLFLKGRKMMLHKIFDIVKYYIFLQDDDKSEHNNS